MLGCLLHTGLKSSIVFQGRGSHSRTILRL